MTARREAGSSAIPENKGIQKKKKKEIQFFSVKDSIVNKFYHFCSDEKSDKLFAKTYGHATIFYGKK